MPANRSLIVLERSMTLERGDWMRWRIDYHLRHTGTKTLILPPSDVAATVAGWVSNSRANGHAVPRCVEVEATGSGGLSGTVEVIASEDEAHRCRERLVLQAWPGESGPEPPEPVADALHRNIPPDEQPELEIAPGSTLRVRLFLEHQHHLCGPHTALLGMRTLSLRLGSATLNDRLPLDRQARLDTLSTAWPPPPPGEFLDSKIFLSAPDSLHLEAHVPGHRSYRFPEYRQVDGGSRMRLSFWYLISPGTAGRCQARVTQCRDLPSSFKTLYDGEVIENLPVTGRWVRVDRVIPIAPEATVVTIDFRITDAQVDMGELWIDDVSLTPLNDLLAGP